MNTTIFIKLKYGTKIFLYIKYLIKWIRFVQYVEKQLHQIIGYHKIYVKFVIYY